ncbi:P-loop containing nucleoside triphosphate hydrolase protein [Trichophaea hybrida]|nr:P-loop containing nucleoside triphosphate hydrolase protein [Trichophaea hybrida]
MIEALHKLDSVYDQSTGERVTQPFDPLRARNDGNSKVPGKYDKWAVILQRVFDWSGELERTNLLIKSPLIRGVIKDVVKSEAAAMESDDASVDWPNDELFRYRNHIRISAEKEGELTVKHVAVLLELIEKEYASKIRDIKLMFPKGTSSFEVLKEAYWPGELLVQASLSRIYRITDVRHMTTQCGVMLSVSCEYIDYDGKCFGTVPKEFRINAFHGVQYINELSAFPLEYHPQIDEIKARLKTRGMQFVALKGQHYKSHAGVARTIQYPYLQANVDSRVMIDTATFNRINPNEGIKVSSISKELSSNGELTEEHLLLCTDTIPIFSFQDKEFYTTSISSITDIAFNEKVFDQLVLPQTQKELVRVLVENHSKGAQFDDFVAGKGKGLISVLHGPPGVGKTMTAEAVAEYTKRPLYIVTSGELGSSPTAMETELERVLDLAKTFRAVLLLDEADVFLEQRTCHDLIRNALVSIFLRQLEYYQGILFLTTNRVGTFDEAFHSRIHISLYYQNLTAEAREQVWRNFAATMQTELKEEDYKELAKAEINGRQVKNVFRTAQALAADKGECIGMRHLEMVLEVMKGFDLAKARGMEGVEK